MTQRTKTIEVAFDTRTSSLATNTTLATATRHDFAVKTIYCPENINPTALVTIRSVEVIITGYAGSTTAINLDGCRIGIKLGAVAFNDLDITGTGLAATGDPYNFMFTRDVTSYFSTNFGTGTSQTCQIGLAIEQASAGAVINLTAKLRMTYEYNDTAATHVKTVRIPLEGNTGFLGTSANADQRGTAGAAQIPDLSTYLPETNKVFRQVWLEIWSTDSGAAVTNFNANFSIDAGTTHAASTLILALNGSCEFYYIWDITAEGGFQTNAVNDFEAWSSLASRFERMYAVLYVTYEYDSSSSSIFNSILISVPMLSRSLHGTAAGDQEVYDSNFYIEEPTTIAIKQSALIIGWWNAAGGNVTPLVAGSGAAGGTQGTTSSTYTGTSVVGSGPKTICHRIDLAHGGSAITLGRGKNTLRLKVFASANNALMGAFAYYIINYTSGKASGGEGSHNHTTWWLIDGVMTSAVAGESVREIATTNQKTPNIPETDYYLNCVTYEYLGNTSSANIFPDLGTEILSGELTEDGWKHQNLSLITDAEYCWFYQSFCMEHCYLKYPSSSASGMNVETARKFRIYGHTAMHGLHRWITYHSITFTKAGTVSGSGGGTVNLYCHYMDGEHELIKTGSRSGNGAYSFTVFDSVRLMQVAAYEDDTHVGASNNDVAS